MERRREIPSLRDPRFEMLELVLLTLGFPFRLGLQAGLLPTKWTIRNDTGGCHFSAKCRALSAGDDGSRLYIFFYLSLLSFPVQLLFHLSHARVANVLDEKVTVSDAATYDLACRDINVHLIVLIVQNITNL